MIKIKEDKITIIDKFKFFFGFEKNKVTETLGISVDSKTRVIAFYSYTVLIFLLAIFKVYTILNIAERFLVLIISLFIVVELLYFLVSKKVKHS
ncbi:hypothetical protein [Clostridium sp. B9]|uniref:hypothetical protein n=1 Tax=Clostridium sp. B9 TaxID=3423224 RepID=UPI003D2EE246